MCSTTVWSVNDGLSGNLLIFYQYIFFQFFLLIKNPETYWKPPRPVSLGFQRFPDNPSLTDHTVPSVLKTCAFMQMSTKRKLQMHKNVQLLPFLVLLSSGCHTVIKEERISMYIWAFYQII